MKSPLQKSPVDQEVVQQQDRCNHGPVEKDLIQQLADCVVIRSLFSLDLVGPVPRASWRRLATLQTDARRFRS